MSGRTTQRWTRVYADGYDISGDARTIGPLLQTYDEADLTALNHGVKGALPGHPVLGIGALNATFNSTDTTGIHAILGSAGVMRTVMVAVGMRAEPAQGDPVYMGQFEQLGYQADPSGVYVNVPFGNYSARAASLAYDKPWGWLLRAKSATTAANTAVGIDDHGAATAFGGYMMYQVFAGDGTATITVEHASTNSNASFSALGGCTTGSIDCSSVKYGIVPTTARTTTVNRYLRWQISLGTATTVTFALGFSRALF